MLNKMCKSKQHVQKAKATTTSNPKRDTQSPKMDADKSKASKGTKKNNFKTHKNSIVIKRNQNLSTKKKKKNPKYQLFRLTFASKLSSIRILATLMSQCMILG